MSRSVLGPATRGCIGSLLAASALTVAGCSPEPEVVPVRTLDRPTDLSFVCAAVSTGSAVGSSPVLSGRPMRVCRPPDGPETTVDLRARTLGTFGLLTNSARNEVAVIDFDRNRVADLDPGNYGFNFLPVGVLPESIATSPDGCRAVTVNRGSCDLSVIDTSRALLPLFPGTTASTEAEGVPAGDEQPVVRTLALQADTGALRTRVGEIQFLPLDTRGQEGAGNPCSAKGLRAGAGFVPYRALVTLPACSLLALVELPSGRLLDSVRVTRSGVVPVGTAPRCPIECRVPLHPMAQTLAGDVDAPDAGVLDAPGVDGALGPLSDGAALVRDAGDPSDLGAADDLGTLEPEPDPGAGIFVSALALLPDGRRVYVGAIDHPAVFAVDLVGDDLYGALRLVGSSHGARIPLAEGAEGVVRLRLSVDPYAEPLTAGETGAFVAALPRARTHEFLYAIALDGSVRVIDVSQRAHTRETECDTQVDVLALPTAEARMRPCHPLSDEPGAARLPRRIFARGPGIRPPPPLPFASEGAGPVPVDVAFGRIVNPLTRLADNVPDDNAFDGAFAYVLYANGQVMVVNVQPSVRRHERWDGVATPATHRQPITHQPRNLLVGEPMLGNNIGPPRLAATPTVALTTNDLPFAVRPQIARERWPQLDGDWTEDPSLHPLAGARSQQMVYAVFPRADEVSGQRWFVTWEGGVPGTGRITGQVLAPPAGSPLGVTALLRDPGADFCESGVAPGDVVRLFGCVSDLECDPSGRMTCVRASAAESGLCFARESAALLAERCASYINSRRRYEVLEASRTTLLLGPRVQEFVRPSIAACQVDEDCRLDADLQAGFVCSELHAGQGRRCIRPCSDDNPCRPGFVCGQAGTPARALCVEAPASDSDEVVRCLAGTRSYRVLAGRSFVVSSDQLPRLRAGREEGGRCIATTGLDSRVKVRISMDAPACVGDGSGAYSVLEALRKFPGQSSAVANPCLFRSADRPGTIKALYEGPWMRFVLTNLEQPFGDGVIVSLTVEGGSFPVFLGQSSSNVVALPTRLVIGPVRAWTGAQEPELRFPYLYMVDAGRAGSGGNRGQILRANTRRAQFDSRFGVGRDGFQIQ